MSAFWGYHSSLFLSLDNGPMGKKVCVKKNFRTKKNFGSKKTFGKHFLCVTIWYRIYAQNFHILLKYQPSGAGGTRSSPATLHSLKHFTAGVIRNGRGGLEIGQTLGYWTLNQLLINRFFDSMISSMRISKIQNGRQGAPKWLTGFSMWSIPRFLGSPINF